MKHSFKEVRSQTVIVGFALLIFLVLNLASIELLSKYRFDFTENRLYTLSDGTRNILNGLNEAITLTYFVSNTGFQDYPMVRAYANRVEDFLREYQRLSNEKVNLRIVYPESFSEEEDAAVGYGLEGLSNRDGLQTYLGLVGFNSVGDTEVIPFFFPEREELLEYDVTRLIYKLDNRDSKKVGIISSLPVQGTAGSGGNSQTWYSISQLEHFFDVQHLPVSESAIPEDISTLILIHPYDYSNDLLYSIDQFVLSGRSLLLLTDPYSEILASILSSVPQMSVNDRGSDLNFLTKNWGVEMVEEKIVGDLPIAARVLEGDGSSGQTVDYPVWMNIQPGQFNRNDVITANLGNVIMATAGQLNIDPESTLDIDPLILSSKAAKLYDVDQIANATKLRDLLDDYKEGGTEIPMAVRIQGKVTSGFTDPFKAGTQSANQVDQDSGHIGSGRINVIMIADTDFLHDRFWIRSQQILGQMLSYAEASNGELFHGAIDNLTGGNDLIALRSRGSFSRPFERIQNVRQDAEREFLEQESKLLEELQRIENLLVEYRNSQNERQTDLILTEEQRDEFNQIRNNQIEIRKELRKVRRNLTEVIDAIEWKIVLINLLLVPIIVAVIGVLTVVYGARRRGAKMLKQVSNLLQAS